VRTCVVWTDDIEKKRGDLYQRCRVRMTKSKLNCTSGVEMKMADMNSRRMLRELTASMRERCDTIFEVKRIWGEFVACRWNKSEVRWRRWKRKILGFVWEWKVKYDFRGKGKEKYLCERFFPSCCMSPDLKYISPK